MKLPATLGIALIALTLVGVGLYVPGTDHAELLAWEVKVVAVMAVQGVIYLLAVGLVLRRPASPGLLWLVLAVAVAIRLPVLVEAPFLSSDVNRYVWDGRVQAAGINPYRYLPSDPALTALRDTPVFTRINRADYARTIYPPAGQMIFAAIGFVWQSVYAVKATMVLFEVVAVLCLLRLLAIAGLPGSRVLIYAWNPLTAWAFAGNGHVDAAAIGLLGLTFLLRVGQRYRVAGVVFGAAVLIKFLPAVVAPALWRPRDGWRLAAAALLTVVALYLPYAGAGRYVLGFLGGYSAEEGIDTGSGVWLLQGLARLMSLPTGTVQVYLAVVGVGLAILAAWIAFRPHPPAGSAQDAVAMCSGAAVLMTCMTVAISPHYPWYFPWLALPCVVVPYRAVLWLSIAPLVLYYDPFDDLFLWSSIIYVPAILLGLLEFRDRRPALPAVAMEGKA